MRTLTSIFALMILAACGDSPETGNANLGAQLSEALEGRWSLVAMEGQVVEEPAEIVIYSFSADGLSEADCSGAFYLAVEGEQLYPIGDQREASQKCFVDLDPDSLQFLVNSYFYQNKRDRISFRFDSATQTLFIDDLEFEANTSP